MHIAPSQPGQPAQPGQATALFVTKPHPIFLEPEGDVRRAAPIGRAIAGAPVTLMERRGSEARVSTDAFYLGGKPLEMWLPMAILSDAEIAPRRYVFPKGQAVLDFAGPLVPMAGERALAPTPGITPPCGPSVVVARRKGAVKLTAYAMGVEVTGWSEDGVPRIFGEGGCVDVTPPDDVLETPSTQREERRQHTRPVQANVAVRKLLATPVWWLRDYGLSNAGSPRFVCEGYAQRKDGGLTMIGAKRPEDTAYAVDWDTLTLFGPGDMGCATQFHVVGYDASKIYFGAPTEGNCGYRPDSTGKAYVYHCTKPTFDPATSSAWFRSRAGCERAASAAIKAVRSLADPWGLAALRDRVPVQGPC